ncbi:MAG: hypothetical protein LPH21_12610 [Shewanella sp.]|nr:hypothetical protein [Shewanella sp.]
MEPPWVDIDPKGPIFVNTALPGYLLPHKQDRGNVYTPETIDYALQKVAEGWTLSKACDELENLPPVEYLRRWIYNDQRFVEAYKRAKELSCDRMEEEILEISDNTFDEKLGIPADVSRDSVRISARKWIMASRLPQKYGNRGSAVTVVNNVDLSLAMDEGENRMNDLHEVIQDSD